MITFFFFLFEGSVGIHHPFQMTAEKKPSWILVNRFLPYEMIPYEMIHYAKFKKKKNIIFLCVFC